jgi:integrase
MFPYYFLFLNQDPDAVIAQRKKDLFSDDASDNERYERSTVAFLKSLTENKSLAGKTVANHLARIQGFYTNNGKRLSLDMPRLRISKVRRTKKYSPSVEEVRQIFSKADCARDKLITALMAHNGPTPIDVSLLCVGDYPLEAWVYFERDRSKTGKIWRGVSTPDVCACLKDYLNVRGEVRVGERLFVGREGVLDSAGISQIVRELIVRAGFGSVKGFKPTSLRDFFEDALVDAEVYPKIKKALMAHTSDIEHEYGGQKKLEAKLVEAMKKVYPLICLNDSFKNVNGFGGVDMAKFNEFLLHLDDFLLIKESIKNGELLDLNNPALTPKLKDELKRAGIIK